MVSDNTYKVNQSGSELTIQTAQSPSHSKVNTDHNLTHQGLEAGLCPLEVSRVLIPDNIQEHICVIDLSIHTVIVQGDDIVELRDRDMHVCVVAGVQGDTPDGSAAGEEQVGLRRGIAGLPISLQLDASGAGTGKARGPRQAEVGAASVSRAALIKTW